MTQTVVLRTTRRRMWRSIEQLVRDAYQQGYESGLARAHGQGRRARTVRRDATVQGLIRLIERHFSLDRYRFEVRIVHSGTGRRVPGTDRIEKYRLES
jgi:hypothetical protein